MRLSVNLIMFLAFAAVTAHAQATVEITIAGVKPGKGNIRVGLFQQDNFLQTPLEGKIVEADASSVVVRFDHVRAGSYAVSVIHDTNKNGDLDRTKLGIPKEGFAFSNDAMGKKGPPTFDKARFEVTGTEALRNTLTMRYPQRAD